MVTEVEPCATQAGEAAPSPNLRPESAPPRKLKVFWLVLFVTVFNALGNLSLAWGMKHLSVRVGIDPRGYLHAMINPFVAAGIALLIMWLLTRMALLSWADLSFVLPVTGIGYFLAAVLGQIFLHERITPGQWLGTLLIFAGTLLVGSTHQKSREVGS